MKNKIKLKNINKLNLGAGKDIKKDFINLDSLQLPGIDVVHNLDYFPYPFKDNTFSYIYCDNVLEHLKELIRVMEDLHRICKNDAEIEIIVPYFASFNAYKDPTHKTFFTFETFEYFTDDHNYNFYTKSRFKIVYRKLMFSKRLKLLEIIMNKIPKFYESYISNVFPANGIKVKLRVIK